MVLLERDRELAAAEAVVERGAILLIEGGAGIGKTSLLEAACARAAEAGCEVLRARGSELEAAFAFGVVRQLFERRLVEADVGEREYNTVRLHAAIGYVTPEDEHSGRGEQIRQARRRGLARARRQRIEYHRRQKQKPRLQTTGRHRVKRARIPDI